jgi:hypothetical protein
MASFPATALALVSWRVQTMVRCRGRLQWTPGRDAPERKYNGVDTLAKAWAGPDPKRVELSNSSLTRSSVVRPSS